MADASLDLDWPALAWYGQPVAALGRPFGLVRPSAASQAPKWMLATSAWRSGHLALVSRELAAEPALAPEVLVGGPCIGDCQAFPTLEALYDVATLVVMAKELGVPCLVYLGDAEESLARGGDARFLELAARFAEWVRGLARTLAWDDVRVVRTSEPAHEDAIVAIDSVLGELTPADLGTAFHVGNGEVLVEDDVAGRVTRRTIAAHHPAVVARHAGLRVDARIAIVENVQQAGCWSLARRSLTEEAASRFGFLGTWPTPSCSGTDRMYRAGSFEKIAAGDLAVVASGERPGTSARTSRFFAAWLDPSTRTTLLQAS